MTKSMKTHGHRSWLAALLCIAAAAGGCDNNRNGGTFVPEEIVPTPRNPEPIASETGCAIDADCAAGLYCFQGACAWECRDDGDCARSATSRRGDY